MKKKKNKSKATLFEKIFYLSVGIPLYIMILDGIVKWLFS